MLNRLILTYLAWRHRVAVARLSAAQTAFHTSLDRLTLAQSAPLDLRP